MGRLFIAVVPEGLSDNRELKQLIAKFKRTVGDRTDEVRWTAPTLWHVIVVFLGNAATDRVREVFESLRFPPEKISLRLQGVGAFPEEKAARVLWIGVHENQELLNIQQQVAQQVTNAGVELSEREFKPHLTVARFRNLHGVTDLVKLGGRKHFGDYPVKEMILFESVLQGNITKYVPLSRRPLY